MLRQYLIPEYEPTLSCIVLPQNATQFNFKPGMIQLLPTFNGMESENPYLFIKDFEDLCTTIQDINCGMEVTRLKFFPFSLKDKAKEWLNGLKPFSIRIWRDMTTGFFRNFFQFTKQMLLKE